MSNPTQCDCNLECGHHQGEVCSNKAVASFEEEDLCSRWFCEMCFPKQCPNCEGRGKIPIPGLLGSGENAGIIANHKNKTCQMCNGTETK